MGSDEFDAARFRAGFTEGRGGARQRRGTAPTRAVFLFFDIGVADRSLGRVS